MHVIGTAGHVDHGKSSLVQALTGIDPDRLLEEKEREMTIDLGFAWMTLPNGYEIGIVDVPGHRDFIENMLAGVGGIDLALFVVAADEGVMPQTSEHLAILNLLEVRGGVVALTKVDLVEDPEWLELVTLDLKESFSGTILSDSPIVSVSIKTGEGIEDILEALQDRLREIEPRPDNGQPRLPIDRVFTLPGFGTIVTGTLSGGHLETGESVEIQPAKLRGRIRGLQTHQTKIDLARPGSRVAVNLSGVDRKELSRGAVVTVPGVVTTTILCDVSYKHLAEAGSPLKHNVPVKLFVGSAEVMARTRVLGVRQIDPGQKGWLQLVLEEPVAIARGDRYILRRPSPPATLGGGLILDPRPGRRHRRYRSDVVERLQTLERGRPADLLLEAIYRMQPARFDQVVDSAAISPQEVDDAWEELERQDRAEMLGEFVLPHEGRKRWADRLLARLGDFYKQSPLRLGMPREELRSRLGLSAAFFNELVDWAAGKEMLVQDGPIIHLPDHVVSFNADQDAAIVRLMERFNNAGVNSPSVKESKSAVGEDVYHALIDLEQLRQVSDEVVYTADNYDHLVGQILTYLKSHKQIDAARLRDLLGTSRKYAIALLEHLDDIHATRRIGDYRELIS